MPIRYRSKYQKQNITRKQYISYDCIVYADMKMFILRFPPQNSAAFPLQGVLQSPSGLRLGEF